VSRDGNSSSSSSGGIGFTGVLAIVFIILKLLRKIDWSWWWVLSPLWIGAVIAVLIIVLVIIGALAASAFGKPKAGRRSR
jgi:hypothetical protein